jgi:hypothetical protein
MKFVAVAALAMLACACASNADDSAGFAHLRTGRTFIESTDGLSVRVEAPGLRSTAPVHRTDTFNGHPFEISLAAFIDGDVAILMHAERVADGSGASDYSELPAAEWPSAAFRTRQFCMTLVDDDIAGEHDLEWLRANGFDPAGALVLDQSFITTPDHNNEVVVSIAVKGVNCEEPSSISAALAAARARAHVTVN